MVESKEISFMEFTGISKIKKRKLFVQAITCKDYAQKYRDFTGKTIANNTTLAIIGDAVLSMALTFTQFKSNNRVDVNHVTNYNQKIERNSNLRKIGENQNIMSIFFATNEDKKGRGVATAYEAIIAYIYLSYGLTTTLDIVKKRIIEVSVDE